MLWGGSVITYVREHYKITEVFVSFLFFLKNNNKQMCETGIIIIVQLESLSWDIVLMGWDIHPHDTTVHYSSAV